LIAKLWETSFLPKHCIDGFCAAGLASFSAEHVMQPSIVSEPDLELEQDKKKSDKVMQCTAKITCTCCGNEMVPTTLTMKLCITALHLQDRYSNYSLPNSWLVLLSLQNAGKVQCK